MCGVRKIISKISRVGFVFINEWLPSLSTKQVGQMLGSIVEIEKRLPGSGITTVQTLKPRYSSDKLLNQYSGEFGLNSFPLHTDLAHWQIPPRYLLLRCIRGFKDVKTIIVDASIFEDKIGKEILKFSMVTPRRKSRSQKIYPLPTKFKIGKDYGIRWDMLFLQPINSVAREVYRRMSSISWSGSEIGSVCLEKAGNTLIVDNWRMLHGRSSVPANAMSRKIQRIYLDNIG